MTEYYSYDGNVKDPGEMHTVEARGIRRYVKGRHIFSSFVRWREDRFWEFTPGTRMVEYHNSSGKGWVTLVGLNCRSEKSEEREFYRYDKEIVFYAYENVDRMMEEILSRGVAKDPKCPSLWGT